MMTLSNGNIFRVTGHLCGEFTGPRWIPRTKASDAEIWCFIYMRLNKRLNKQSWGCWFETLSRPLWRQCNVYTGTWKKNNRPWGNLLSEYRVHVHVSQLQFAKSLSTWIRLQNHNESRKMYIMKINLEKMYVMRTHIDIKMTVKLHFHSLAWIISSNEVFLVNPCCWSYLNTITVCLCRLPNLSIDGYLFTSGSARKNNSNRNSNTVRSAWWGYNTCLKCVFIFIHSRIFMCVSKICGTWTQYAWTAGVDLTTHRTLSSLYLPMAPLKLTPRRKCKLRIKTDHRRWARIYWYCNCTPWRPWERRDMITLSALPTLW